MTSQSPRIYIYKITFDEVLYYYYGVKKEKKYNEYYMGSPITHKWMWDFYTPKKQILEIFDFTNEGWLEAQEVEKRIIRPFLDNKWCLNENVGGIMSLEILRKNGKVLGEAFGKRNGKINGNRAKELGLGIHGLTLEQLSENGKKNGKKSKELGIGVHGRTKEQMDEDARKGGKKSKELGIGVHGRTKEQMTEDSGKGGKKSKELGIGVHGRTKEQMTEDGKKGGKIGGKNVASQKWICLETGHISTPAGLAIFQNKRGIDTSKRKRIE